MTDIMIPIVFSTDHNYVMPTGVTIASLLLSADGETYDIYIMAATDVTEEDRQKLRRQVKELSPDSSISFIEMEKYFNGGFEIRGISTACYYRLMIPWVIPDIDKIIYSDVDIIFKSSLKDLYDINLEGKYIAGGESRSDSWKRYKHYFEKIGLDYREYFNSGMLVINSKLQRENQLKEQYEELARKKFLYQDQDILNIVCKGKTAFFDRRYNLFPPVYDTEPTYKDNVVIHYAGGKPWNEFTFAWAEWWDVYKKSIFHEYGYYSHISRKILNPKQQIKTMVRKGKWSLQILRRKLF